MKRILHLYKEFYPVSGGIQQAIKSVVELTPEYEHTILTTSSELDGTESLYGAKVIYCKKLAEIMSTPITFKYISTARKLIKEHDIVCAHYPYPMNELVLLGLKPKKLIYFWHSDIVSQKIAKHAVYPFVRMALKKADKVFISYPEMATNSDVLNAFADKTVVSSYYVDTTQTEASTDDVKAKYGRYMLGIGRLVPYKGFDYMIRAMKDIGDMNLVIVGSGPVQEELDGLITELGLQERVFIVNGVTDDQLKIFCKGCEFFVFPSCLPSEAFGIATLEAMVYGKAVLNTWLHTGVNYVARDGEEAVTVEAKSASALASGANRLGLDVELRDNLGYNAKLRVESFFTKEKRRSALLSEFGD
ncbi:glycosyl transferase group 1 [Denitrovibrio acetiphilus DSM 12809]|uniref:Glycosyl transferase group 1 n=1 Tax=Denitrovibrio acetiphilus (strain DSM 12809 / NBRC 114555 / N2460) TaxID=522772 RepID=D4H577_DENA2|nr:glycosyltransferase [Denitrovibrio acetiphilus]ADD69433.1 glycosyl transferase group 1 [Denitrovibrio acetiphilus DSM 12809]